jgi:predicted DNA-binding transcriptional regulator YafY
VLAVLRAALADRHTAAGLPTTAEQVHVTHGAQHAIDLALAALCRPGAAVAVEDPTYPGVLDVLAARRLRAVPLLADGRGPTAGSLDAAARDHGARVAFLLPAVHSPTGRVLDPGRRQALARALDKLAGVLGGADGMAVELGPARFLEPLRHAAEAGERVEIDYYAFGRDALTTRRIDPRAVFAASGQWYVDAWCHQAGDERLFRVDRVQGLRPTGERFDLPGGSGVPPGMSADSGASTTVFHPRPDDPRVTLLLPAEARWVTETYPTESVTEEADGRLKVVLAASGRAWLERLLLRLGPSAVIQGPEDARRTAAAAAGRLLAR